MGTSNAADKRLIARKIMSIPLGTKGCLFNVCKNLYQEIYGVDPQKIYSYQQYRAETNRCSFRKNTFQCDHQATLKGLCTTHFALVYPPKKRKDHQDNPR